MTATTAIAMSPRPASASAAVASTQPIVDMRNSHCLRACTSAYAPIIGIDSITAAFETARITVHTGVAQVASLATPLTKYALNTAVSTTVV